MDVYLLYIVIFLFMCELNSVFSTVNNLDFGYDLITFFIYEQIYTKISNIGVINYHVYLITDYLPEIMSLNDFESLMITASNNFFTPNIYTFHTYIAVNLIMKGYKTALDYTKSKERITPHILKYSIYNNSYTFNFGTYTINNTNTLSGNIYIAELINNLVINTEEIISNYIDTSSLVVYNRENQIIYYSQPLYVANLVVSIIEIMVLLLLSVGIIINRKSKLFRNSGFIYDSFLIIGSIMMICYNVFSFRYSVYKVLYCQIKYPLLITLYTLYIMIYGSKIIKILLYYLNRVKKLV